MKASAQTKLRAIFGGTFDPPHLGHLQPLLWVLDTLQMDSCELIPSHIPVHKQASASVEHRVKMTELFAQQDPRLIVNNIEILQNTPSYTINTLDILKKQYPQDALCFIMGLDAFLGLPSWFKPEKIIARCHIVVMMRDSKQSEGLQHTDRSLIAFLETQTDQAVATHSLTALPTSLSKLLPEHVYLAEKFTQNAQNQQISGILRASKQGEVVFVFNKQADISSTIIRQAITDGVSVEQWLSPEVSHYIQTHHIY